MAPKYTRVATLDEAAALTVDELLALGLLPPIAGADGADDPEPDPAPAADPEPADDPADDPEDPDEPDESEPTESEWKRMARKWERESKKARKEREDLARKLKEREDADRTEQEKALDKAREDAVKEIESKFEKERRQDRLEVATTKLAARGMKVGSGDDAKTLRFADPDDALVYLDRDIRDGTLDAEDIFDANGKVKADALEEALTDLLERKPHLAAESSAAARKVKGSGDGGKGAPVKTEGSVADEFSKVRRHRPGTPAVAVMPGTGR